MAQRSRSDSGIVFYMPQSIGGGDGYSTADDDGDSSREPSDNEYEDVQEENRQPGPPDNRQPESVPQENRQPGSVAPDYRQPDDDDTGRGPLRTEHHSTQGQQAATRNSRTHSRCYKSKEKGPNMKPRTFTGNEDFEEFIDHFEVVAEMGGWSIRNRALTLRACLSGKAHIFLAKLPNDIKTSYVTLVDALRKRFGGANQQPMWVSTLKGRKRQPAESIASYGDELSHLARKAYADLDYVAQERMALDQLYSSISPELRLKCIERDCRTVDQAVALIQTHEGVMRADEQGRSRVRMVASESAKPKQSTDAKASSDDTMQKLITRMERLEKQNQQLKKQQQNQPRYNRPSSSVPRVCFTCGAPDHLYRNCPVNNTNNAYWRNESFQAAEASAPTSKNTGNDQPLTL